MNPDLKLCYEELHVGQVFVSGSHTLELAAMRAFALEFDPQPIHLDENSTLLGGIVASGWYTAAITHRLLIQDGFPMKHGMIGLGIEMSWPAPARPGDSLRVKTRIERLRASKSNQDRGIVTMYSETLTAQDVVVQKQTATIAVTRG
jgi:acyl dehydratase